MVHFFWFFLADNTTSLVLMATMLYSSPFKERGAPTRWSRQVFFSGSYFRLAVYPSTRLKGVSLVSEAGPPSFNSRTILVGLSGGPCTSRRVKVSFLPPTGL